MTLVSRALPALIAACMLAACGSADNTTEVADTPAPEPVDRTGDLAEWADVITTATEPEPGRITVVTTLSEAADDAAVPMAICQAAAELDGVTYVSVAEADGTTWVLYGHPAYPDGLCSPAADPQAACEAEITQPAPPQFFRGVVDPHSDNVTEWIRRIQVLPMNVVDEILRGAQRRGLVDATRRTAYRDYLLHRKNELVALVHNSLDEPR